MTALGIMGVTTPAECLTRGDVEGSSYFRRRFVPVTSISMCRLPQREQTNRPRQSITVVSAPYRATISGNRARPDVCNPGTR
jgi:hypothetical protein